MDKLADLRRLPLHLAEKQSNSLNSNQIQVKSSSRLRRRREEDGEEEEEEEEE